MQDKIYFKTSKIRLIYYLCSTAFCMLVTVLACLWMIIIIKSLLLDTIRIIPLYGLYGLAIFSFIIVSAVLYLLVWLLFVLGTVYYFDKWWRHLSLCVSISEDGVEIRNNKGTCSITMQEITHIFPHKENFILVWNVKNKPITFSIPKEGFRSKDLKKISERLSSQEQYTDDKVKIKQISKTLKLNNVFRKNRLKYYFAELSKDNPKA